MLHEVVDLFRRKVLECPFVEVLHFKGYLVLVTGESRTNDTDAAVKHQMLEK